MVTQGPLLDGGSHLPSADQGTPETDDTPTPYVYESPAVGRVEIPVGYPTPQSTGLARLGVAAAELPLYDGPTTITDFRTIEGVRIESRIVVDGGDLTIRGAYIESDREPWVLHTRSGGRLTIEDSTVRALNGATHLLRGGRITIRRSDLRQGTTIAQLQSHSLVEDSFIADAGIPAHPDGHHDGVQILNAREGVTLLRNTILGRFQRQNSAVHVQGHANWSGVHDVHIEGNFLSGGNYTLYLEAHPEHSPLRGAVVRDNLWNTDSWRYGPVSRRRIGDDLVWEQNRTTDGEEVE